MPIQSFQLSIKFLFEQNHTFVVPLHQRGYAWDDKSINDFVGDIDRCLKSREANTEKTHFFGSVITIQRQVSNSNRLSYEVIDGQQRLASFVMLVAAISRGMNNLIIDINSKGSLSTNEKEAKTYLENKVKELRKNYLVYEDEIDLAREEVPKIILSNADKNYFQNLIDGQGPTPVRDSHKRIQVAWNCLVKYVDSIINEIDNLQKKIKRLQLLVDKVLISDCSVIFMRSDMRGTAYQIFLVLNNRGELLTNGDLLRARTMELLDDSSLSSIQNSTAEFWDKVLAYPPNDIEDYLRWYFSSWHGRRPTSSGLVEQFLEHRFQYRDQVVLNSNDAKKVLGEVRQLDKEFSSLKTLRLGNWPCEDHSHVKQWDCERLRMLVSHLNHTNAMPLLLSLLKLSPKKFADAVASIERFVFRFKIIGKAHIGSATKLYLKHAKNIRESNHYSVENLRADLRTLVNKTVPESVFKANLKGIRYSPQRGNSYIRYFLITLEDYRKWYEHGAQGTPKCTDKTRIFDFSNTNVEHVYPQNATDEEWNAKCEEVKHTIGNLTILGPEDNKDIANKPFQAKREVFRHSNVWLNRDIGENEKWRYTEIRKRCNQLVQMSAKIFVP